MTKQRVFRQGLTYDESCSAPVLDIRSRKDVDTSTRLTKRISLRMPIVSANMDTVTESEMAIAMARHGGIGIIHRFNTIEQQVTQVTAGQALRELRHRKPVSPSQPESTVGDARELLDRHQITGLPVVDEENTLMGLLSGRDILFVNDDSRTVLLIA